MDRVIEVEYVTSLNSLQWGTQSPHYSLLIFEINKTHRFFFLNTYH